MSTTTNTKIQTSATSSSKAEKKVELKTTVKISKSKSKSGYTMTVTIAGCTRTAMGKIIPIMNREYRPTVGSCSMIVWSETEENMKMPFATGKFTAESRYEEPLEQLAKLLVKALTSFDEEVRVNQSQRALIHAQRQLEHQQRQQEYEQRRLLLQQRQQRYEQEQELRELDRQDYLKRQERRAAEKARRTAEYERRKLEQEELAPYIRYGNERYTIADVSLLKIAPDAPRKDRQFRPSLATINEEEEEEVEDFPALTTNPVRRRLNFEATTPVPAAASTASIHESSAWDDEN